MSLVRLGINGFGRIGRLCLRSAFTENPHKATIMAINDHSKDLDYLIYMLKYDSVHSKLTFLFSPFTQVASRAQSRRLREVSWSMGKKCS